MRRRHAVALLAVPAATVVSMTLVACNALTGANDLGTGNTDTSSGGNPSRDEAGRPLDGSGNGGEGGAPGDEGGAEVITPSLAACGANSVCMTNTGGWTPAVHLLFDLGGGCPAEWPDRKVYKKSGGGSCECRCTPNVGACAGPIDMRAGAPLCNGPATSLAVSADGACSTLASPLPSPVSLTPTGAPPSSCSGSVADELGAPDDALTCSGAAPTTSPACGAGEVCVPKPSSPIPVPVPTGVVCMAHDGETECPKNLPFRLLLGTSIDDQRSCSTACTCTTTTCKAGKLDAFKDGACTDRERTFDVNGSCIPGAASTATSFRYTPPTGCAVQQAPQVLGTETRQSPRTLCCATPTPF